MIYLDNAATTKPCPDCLNKAENYLLSDFYNPSALYAGGYALHREIEKVRKTILNCIANDEAYDLIFTSGGTEADNQSVFCGGKRGNVVTTAGEHSAVMSAVNELKQHGIEVRIAPLNPDGRVNTEKLLSLVDDKTSLVSVIHVNNETGAINDISAISSAVKNINSSVIFHADGVQAFGKLPFRLTKDIDLYSVSAHKIGAVKGTGALFKRKELALKPYIYGGGQEKGLRSGTENVFGIKFMEFAAEKRYANLIVNFNKTSALKQKLIDLLDPELFEIPFYENTSPYILTVIAKGVRGEIIMHELDDKGLIVGTGAACSSNEKKRYSRVILACGISEDRADGVLRLSFSPDNTEVEVGRAALILNETVKYRRDMMN